MDREERNERIYRAYVEDVRRHGEVDWDRIRANLRGHGIDLSYRQTRRVAYRLEEERGEKAEAEREYRYGPGPDDEPPDENEESVEFKVDSDYADARRKP